MKPLPSLTVLQKLFHYEPHTGHLLRKQRYGNSPAGKPAERKNCSGYMVVFVQGQDLLAHRVAVKLATGLDPDGVVDHINGNKSDNSYNNLRVVTQVENGHNRAKLNRNNTSKVPGVSKATNAGWMAEVTHRGQRFRKWHMEQEEAIKWLEFVRERLGITTQKPHSID